MSTRIELTGTLGEDVRADDVQKKLDAARGDNLDIRINSVGGSVFQGTAIYNSMRSYQRKYPAARIEITITGLAASMASYLAALPGARVIAYDNAVWMAHNPSNIAIGDYRDMAKNSEFLSGLASLMRKAYAARSGKSVDDIARMMDETTWLFGDEIRTEGFADEIIASPERTDEDETDAVARAQLAYGEAAAKLQDRTTPYEAAAIATAVITEANKEEEENQMTKQEHEQAIAATIAMIQADATLDPAVKAMRIAALKGVEAPEGSEREETADHDLNDEVVIIPSGAPKWLPTDAYRNREALPVNEDRIVEV